MSQLLEQALGQVNSIRKRALWFTILLRLLRASCLGCTMFVLWMAVQPSQEWTAISLGFLTFVLALVFQVKSGFYKIKAPDFLVALDMNHPDAKSPPFDLVKSNLESSYEDEWRPRLAREVAEMKSFELSRIGNLLSSLPLPFACLILAFLAQPLALTTAFDKVSHVVARLGDGATLQVVQGAPGDNYKEPLVLGKETHKLEILMQNMLEIRVIGPEGLNPRVDLRKRVAGTLTTTSQTSPFQSFRLTSMRQENQADSSVYVVAFSVKENVDLYLSTESADTPVASINVRTLPLPKVHLEVDGPLKTPWPDDRPLPLSIGVTAKNPLKQIRLTIRAEGRSSSEVVSNILVNDKKNLTTSYDLLLENYVQSDLSRVEIIAEAVDSAVPIPLVGQSEPLFLETASAYGRYRQTLATLRQLKELVDEAAKNQSPRLDPEAKELSSKALTQSQDSPFFDGLDRVTISSFATAVKSIEKKPSYQKILELQEALNEFLYEHETLDDRERDRDFFVAARALSRLVERPKDKRAVKLKAVTERITSYLKERQKRWAVRVKYLDEKPESWPKIQKKPFEKAILQVEELDQKGGPQSQAQALNTLSKAVAGYRSWIDELEKKEQEERAKREQKRREGLTSARNKLKELQRRQGQVSGRLDKAATRKQDAMADAWPSVRMMQNTNIGDTKKLEAQLRSLSPKSGERIKAAIEAMKMTLEAGNSQAFVQSESASDMAGRLLRQAQSAASQSQRQKRRRERRRRVTGDSYYGRQIVGGDVEIKREYSVDRRYREEILDEVSSSKESASSEEEARILEDYLRKVVR